MVHRGRARHAISNLASVFALLPVILVVSSSSILITTQGLYDSKIFTCISQKIAFEAISCVRDVFCLEDPPYCLPLPKTG